MPFASILRDFLHIKWGLCNFILYWYWIGLGWSLRGYYLCAENIGKLWVLHTELPRKG